MPFTDKKIIALIPARGGSKGLPGKNIRQLHGKPLIAWTIEQALASKLIDEVLVSTDDTEIAAISKEYGAEVPFLRPAEFAQDSSPIIDTIRHTLDYYPDRKYDMLLILEATSPMRKKGDLDRAIQLLLDNWETADSLVSLGEVHLEHPNISKVLDNNYVRPVIKNVKTAYQRQQLEKVYFPYCVIYASKVSTLLETETFYQERTISYPIERWQNYEIDDIYDFMCVETIFKEKMKEIV